MEETRRSNLAQKNILTLAMAMLKNLFCTILHLLVSLRDIGVIQEVYLEEDLNSKSSHVRRTLRGRKIMLL